MSRGPAPGRGGFTLIELMIVVGILAVVASLVIPNFMLSKAASNEATAIASLRAYAAAQVAFKRNDCDNDGLPDFADECRDLYYATGAGDQPVKLIARTFADADAPENSVCGYYYEDLDSSPDTTYDHEFEYGLGAIPANYGRSGINTFVIDVTNVVYQKDRGNGDSLNGQYPDIAAETWATTGQ